MVRNAWSHLARNAFFSLISRLAERRRVGSLGARPRRRSDRTLAVAAELLEERQLLSAAITAVSPNSAQAQGGTSVNIVGSGFTNVTGVMFGTVAATSFTVGSSTAITAVAPAEPAGQVDIIVDTTAGNSPVNPQTDQFTYLQSGPQVTAVGPASGGTAGGTSVAITGTGFSQISSVMFGNSFATSFTVNSATSISAVAPSHMAGAVDVTVVASMGSSAVNPAHDQFTYTSTGPAVTSVSPGTGTASGGASVTILGSGFTGITGVTFGGTAATSFTINSPTSITAVAPSHTSGSVDILVSTSSGSSAVNSGDQFIYTAPVLTPQVTSLSTTTGTTAGGTSVSIMGANFTNVTGVSFGGTAARSFTVNSSGSITAVTGAAVAGLVDVSVTNSAGTSAVNPADQFTFLSPNPVVSSLSISNGTTAGGASVTISGINLLGTTQVFFGAVAAQSFVENSPNSITAFAPAEVAGTVDVTVQTPNGSSAISTADRFTFVVPAPVVASLSASSGPVVGSTSVTITGNNFTGVTGVAFGGMAAASFTVSSAGVITAVTPAETAGVVDVTVTSAGGTSATSLADQFTFLSPPPTVTALSIATGSTNGGTTVTITGTNFTNVIGVAFGGTAAGTFVVNSATSISAVAIGQPAGTVDVTVTTKSGTSALSAADQFTFQGSSSGGSGGSGSGASGTTSTVVPTLLGLSVAGGSTAGSTAVTIFGAGFTGTTGVFFGSVAATSLTLVSDGVITAVAPPQQAATVDVTVVNGKGTSATTSADQFTYAVPGAAPTITGLDVGTGSTAGGDIVTITGTNFSGVSGVSFGNTAATQFLVVSPTSLLAVAPAEAAGIVDLTITTTGGTSATSTADQFTFQTPVSSGGDGNGTGAPPPALPTVTGLSVGADSIAGGQSVTISGTNFTGTTAVFFGAVAAASFAVTSDGSVIAVDPAQGAGTVDVTVQTLAGNSAVVSADQFTYNTPAPPPTVTALSTSLGSTSGGTAVTITGTNFSDVTGVSFGGVAANSFTVVSGTTINAIAPGEASAIVDLTVTTTGGTSPTSTADQYTFTYSAPVVTGLSTNSGFTAGGDSVTIFGINLAGTTAVFFGAVAAASFTINDDGTITAVTPAQVAGITDITLQTPIGLSAVCGADQFTYTPAGALPTITALSTTIGTTGGGQPVMITGTNFTDVTGVLFGTVAATSFRVEDSNTLVAVAPPQGAGNYDVTVTTTVGTSAVSPADQFSIATSPPVVSGLSAASGYTTGGDSVTLFGIGFIGATQVFFGGSAASAFTINSDNSITAVAPPEAAGTVDITVQTPIGTSSIGSADQFTFTPAGALPTVTALSTAVASTAGGSRVVITGTNFTDVTGVSFGTVAATSFTVTSPTSLIAFGPAESAGTVDVTVTTRTGTSATSTADLVAFQLPVPTVTGLSAASGFTTGGDSITITGTNLTGATAVFFGAVAATTFTVNQDGTITAAAPAGSAGSVDITVTTPYGTTAASPADQFTYTLAGASPTVTALSATTGSSNGGDSLTITGANFTDVTGVSFGGVAAITYTVNSPTSIVVSTPPGIPGSVDVTVTTTAAASATSAADKFAYSDPSATGSGTTGGSGSGTSGTGTSGSGTGGTTISGTQYYVVTPWPYGSPGSNAPLPTGPAGMGAFGGGVAGLMNSFTPPLPPTVPTINPTYTYSMTAWSMSDGGTVVYTEPMTDGSSGSGTYTDTVTFTITENSTFGSTGNSSSITVTRQDNTSTWMQSSGPGGTGYIKTDVGTSSVTYTRVSQNNTDTYTVDSHGSDNFGEHQIGVSAPEMADHADNADSGFTSFRTHEDATVVNGLATVNVNSANDGSDVYLHSDTQTTADSSMNDVLRGLDQWHHDNNGNYTQLAGGGYTAWNDANKSGSGRDLFSDINTLDSTTVAPDAGGSTTIVDHQKTTDAGRDEYSVSASDNASQAADGTITAVEQHNDTDDGIEKINASDSGTVDSTETNPDGSLVVGHDDFSDFNKDNSDYNDSDVEAPASSGSPALYSAASGSSGESDQLKSHDDDSDTFGSSDNAKVVLTNTAPTGAVTKVTFTDNPTDTGKSDAHDEIDDSQQLASAATGETDDVTVGESADVQDTATENSQINVSILGLVAANDYVNLTETLTLGDLATATDSIGDSGTEDSGQPVPGQTGVTGQTTAGASGGLVSDTEQDTFTDKSDVNDTITLGDTLSSTEKVIGTKGGYSEVDIQSQSGDTITDDNNVTTGDQHTASLGASGAGETDTDLSGSDDKSTLKDVFSGNFTVKMTAITPVTNGTLANVSNITSNVSDTITDTSENVSNNNTSSPLNGQPTSNSASNKNADDLTDQGSGTINGQQFSLLAFTDPTTGMATNVLVGDSRNDKFTINTGDNLFDSIDSSGNRQREATNVVIADNFGDRGLVDISVVGKPQSGVSVDFETQLKWTDNGSDTVKGNDTSSAPGSDTGGDTFQDNSAFSVGGKSQSTIINTFNTNDSLGNTVNATDTMTDKAVFGANVANSDNGEDNFSDSSGQPPTDNEQDTDRTNALGQLIDTGADNFSGTIVAIDPATGMKATYTIGDLSGNTDNSKDVADSSDVHTSGIDGPGADAVTAGDEFIETDQTSDHGSLGVVISGTDSQGEQVSIQQTVAFDRSGSAAIDDDVKSAEAVNGATQTSDNLVATGTSSGTISVIQTGAVTVVDPTSGVKTVTTDNTSVSASGGDQASEGETVSTSSSGTNSDTASQTDSLSGTIGWNVSETSTQTNADGTSAGTPTGFTDSGSDTINASAAIAPAANGTTSATAIGNETGMETSSAPINGSPSWSNTPVAQSGANQLAAGSQFMATASNSSRGSSTSSSSPAASTPTVNSDDNGLGVGAYFRGVGSVFVGYYKAGSSVVTGTAHAVMHPIDTAVGVGKAIASPVQTTKAIASAIAEKSQTLEGQGEIVGTVLIAVGTVATPFAATAKVATTVTAVGETALAAEATNAVSKIGSVAKAGQAAAAAEAGLAAGEAGAAAGDAANAAASAAKVTSAVADTVAAEGRLANVRSAARAPSSGVGKYSVGPYNEMKGQVLGLDAHHVGQQAAMKKLVPGYDPATSPTILVPKVGHTIKGPNGIVSRSGQGLNTARDVIARDINELRRVYPDIPNSTLQDLIDMNKNLYPAMRK